MRFIRLEKECLETLPKLSLKRRVRNLFLFLSVSMISTALFSPIPALCEDDVPEIVLTKAQMCEFIKGFEPANTAVVFPISFGKIFCFTAFENISHTTYIYHKWYHRDRYVASNRFRIKPPKWSTFSTMQLRVADKGPWRVDITDDNDTILKTLRFSVSD